MQAATLVLLLKDHPVAEVLLGYKKIGFGQGKYTGFGGKVEPGETVAEAALRELTEETSVTVTPADLKYAALLEFYFPHKPAWSQRVSVYTARRWDGIPTESDEMIPQWFAVDQIPYAQMWDDGHYWLPFVLSGEKFQARCTFNADNATVKNVHVSPLTT